jgi:aminoglycoside 3-N-acetyltransferase
MNQSYERIREDLAALGLEKGDAVLVHSSFKSMGAVEGGIQTFVEALLSVIGDRGTLIVPTLTFVEVSEENRVFDYLRSASCVGAVSEFVPHMDGAKRSVNPTHSCAAIGCKRDWYVGGHQNDRTPVGPNSPIWKLHEDGGKVLMLGCRLTSNTSLHGIQEKAGVTYLMAEKAETYQIILSDRVMEMDYIRHNDHARLIGRYNRLEQVLSPEKMSCGNIHGAKSWLIDAPAMWEESLKALEKDPYYFIDFIRK